MKITGNNRANRLEGTNKADTIFGLGGNDKISGRGGADIIDGGAGNDTIGGGSGHDKLTGGAGADTFVFRSFKAADSDHVTDFKHGVDKLAFDHATFSTLKAGSLSGAAFFAGTKAHDGSDRFIYDKKTGHLYYDDDGKGGHAQHLVATLDNHTSLTASDFLLI
jgi:Ca2+-binding RTX toxin-like protein